MKILKRLLTVLLCAIISISFFTTVSAATNPTITVSSVESIPGETVKVDIEISDNPGIMAMAFCITYNSDVLTYKSFEKGYLSSYTVKDHSDKGHVAFVNVENKDKDTDGIIISLLFEVKSDAAPGNYVISLANSNRDKYGTRLHNSFSNSTQDFIEPRVVSGGVTIPESCEIVGHQYGEWNITKQATFKEDGIMSRHCVNCDEVTDEIVFKLGDANGDGSVNGRDYSMVIQYLNDWDVTINMLASDVNGDGSINGRDYAMLLQYLND